MSVVLVLVCSTLCPFLIYNHVAGEERAGCFAGLVFLIPCASFIIPCLFLAVLRVGLQCVIVTISWSYPLTFFKYAC